MQTPQLKDRFVNVASWRARLAILRENENVKDLLSEISINYPRYNPQPDAADSGAEFSYSTSMHGNFFCAFTAELQAITGKLYSFEKS